MQATPVFQTGTMIPRNLARFDSNGLVADAGNLLGDTVSGLGVNPFAITDTNGPGLALHSAASGSAHNAFTLGHDASGNALITVDSYGGLADKTIYLRKNGALYEFPFSLSGIAGPVSSTVGHVAIWNNISGSLLADPSGSTATRLTNRSDNYLATANYVGAAGALSPATAGLVEILGSAAAPDASQDSVVIFQKTSNNTSNGTGLNATLYVSHSKKTGATGSHVVAGFFEGQADTASSLSTDFVEGAREHGIIAAGIAGGSAYGSIMVGMEGAGATHGGYLVGGEVEVINNSADAGAIWNSGNSTANHFEAGLVISASGTKKSLAGIIINPFIAAAAALQFGIFMPPGQTNSPIISAGIRIDCASVWGIDLSNSPGPTFGAIALNNNSPIRGVKFDRSTTLSMMYVGTTDRLAIGDDAGLVGVLLGQATVPTTVRGPLEISAVAGATIRAGNGAGTGTQPKGSLWMRTDGGVGSTLYVSQGGGTWNPVAAV